MCSKLSIVNIISGDLYDHLYMSTRIFTLIMIMDFHFEYMSFEKYEESGYGLDLNLLVILY